MSDASTTIFHNPAFGIWRNMLAWNWPIVLTTLRTRLCRPSEAVLDIPLSPQLAPFVKQDGKLVIDVRGRRVAC
jgi:hypothetical protein